VGLYFGKVFSTTGLTSYKSNKIVHITATFNHGNPKAKKEKYIHTYVGKFVPYKCPI